MDRTLQTRFYMLSVTIGIKEDEDGKPMAKKTALVRIQYRSTHFPDICPVCGEPATTEGTVPAMTLLQRQEAKQLNNWSFTSSRVVASTRSMPAPGSTMRIAIPACDRHAISFEDRSRSKGGAAGINGLLIVASVFLAVITVATYMSTSILNTTLLFWFGLTALGAVCTYKLAGPSALERTVSVLDMTSDMSTILLRITNQDYAEKLLRLNPMAAERATPGATRVMGE